MRAAQRDELIAAIDAAVRARGGREERGEVRFRCAAHDDEHPSARWHPTRHVWRCDACGAGGGYMDIARLLGLYRETVWAIRDIPDSRGLRTTDCRKQRVSQAIDTNRVGHSGAIERQTRVIVLGER